MQEGSGLPAQELAHRIKTAARCTPWSAAAHAADEQRELFKTTSQAANEQRLTAPPPAPPRKPALVKAASCAVAALAKHSSADPQVAASTLPNDPAAFPTNQGATTTAATADRWATTYRNAYELDRQAALSIRPRSDYVPDKCYPLNSKLKADTWQAATMCEGTKLSGGRGGSRGEFTRWPAESGSRYGVSVFADEYAAGRLM